MEFTLYNALITLIMLGTAGGGMVALIYFTESPADRVIKNIKERGPFATITIGETVEVEYHDTVLGWTNDES